MSMNATASSVCRHPLRNARSPQVSFGRRVTAAPAKYHQHRQQNFSQSGRRHGASMARATPEESNVSVAGNTAAASVVNPGVSSVEVRVYDIDRYGLAPLASKALRKPVEGIYHVAIAVYGKEYWYDHQINQVDLSEVEYCHGFGPCNTYHLGSTNLPREEFEAWLYTTIKDEYTIDKYDCFYHNCHHFADQLARELTDGAHGIPQWCIDHGEKGLEMLPTDRADIIRNASNKIARVMMVAWGRYNQERFKSVSANV